MSQAFTPGPWVSEYRNRAFFDVFAAARTTDSARVPKIAEVVSNGAKGVYEMRANARLIAAAPDLLAALRDVLYTLEQMEDVCDGNDGRQVPNTAMSILSSHGDAMRAAIAAATGEKV